MRAKFVRVLVLILILPLVVIIFSPSSKVSAQCNTSDSGIKVESGLISAPSLSFFEALTTGTGVSCIGSNRAVIPQFAITTYDEMKTLYYDQATCTGCKNPLTGNRTNADINLPASGNDKLYWISGNLTLDQEINPIGKSGVIFVDGNLFINNKQTNNNNTTGTTGLLFIVQGKIYIKPDVDQIDAFMISYGGFCSAYQATDPIDCADTAVINQQRQLTINGSVISLSSTAPEFVRQKATQTTAAETINYEPKYLVILKDIFARDLKIWKEVQ